MPARSKSASDIVVIVVAWPPLYEVAPRPGAPGAPRSPLGRRASPPERAPRHLAGGVRRHVERASPHQAGSVAPLAAIRAAEAAPWWGDARRTRSDPEVGPGRHVLCTAFPPSTVRRPALGRSCLALTIDTPRAGPNRPWANAGASACASQQEREPFRLVIITAWREAMRAAKRRAAREAAKLAASIATAGAAMSPRRP
jgi:hypothetical protein